MIDYFALALCHGLLLLMLWRIQQRPDLDREEWIEQGALEGAEGEAADGKLTARERRRARRARGQQAKRGDGGDA